MTTVAIIGLGYVGTSPPNRTPDLSHVESTATVIGPHLRPGQLVVLESTTYRGTTKPDLEIYVAPDSRMTRPV
jgi:UDP-N-acetyl-D-glucosamine dehydrogenase